MDKIQEIFEEEVAKQSEIKLANFFAYVSKRYHIPREQLLQDWSNSYEMPPRKNCLLCKNKPKYNGYCKKHIPTQEPPPPPPPTKPVHTHSFPPIFLRGCPACDMLH